MSTDPEMARALTNPPVVEAVAGIEFRSRGMDVVGLVSEAAKWRDKYPHVSAQPALPATRPFGQPDPGFEMQLMGGAPPTRLWSAAEDEEWLVQTQEDRLLLNWRKVTAEASYPRYDDAIRPRVLELLQMIDLGFAEELVPLVAEFSYVNNIATSPAGLHAEYARFRPLEVQMPGQIVAERYEAASEVHEEWGVGQVTATIQPGPESGRTIFTVSTKYFASSPRNARDTIGMIDRAHELSKKTFFAIVSNEAIDEWEAGQ